MSVLERIRADMGRWEAVRAEVLRGLRAEAPAHNVNDRLTPEKRTALAKKGWETRRAMKAAAAAAPDPSDNDPA